MSINCRNFLIVAILFFTFRAESQNNTGNANDVKARFSVSPDSENSNLKAVLDSFAITKDFHGAILVKREDKILYRNSFGTANIQKNVPNGYDTRFLIASITKLFTSVLILQLAEEGKIKLESPIKDYLPDYSGMGGKLVSVHHLLNHTSGIQNSESIRSDTAGLPDVYLDKVSLGELLKKYCSGPLDSKPGSRFNYNNGEYIILGKIIERALKKSFENVLKDKLLDPLNMDDTGLVKSSKDMDGLAQGYKWNEEENSFEKDPDRRFENYYSAGAMYSTIEDLEKFSEALFGGRLLTEISMNRMIKVHPESESYGYGVWVRHTTYNNTDSTVIQRFGKIWGVNTLLSHFLNQDITMIILANTNKVNVSEFQNLVGYTLVH